ncbi:bifunctional 4-hydroxy-2-oxoglutarate aldolase/2-dehydro-3-deoxy-phosphogluconate aldolase [Desulforhopalus sp. 52FAK]
MASDKIQKLESQLQEHRLVPVVALPSVDAGLQLAEILVRCGLPVAEITFRTECAAEAISEISRQYPQVLLLAGTVLSPEQVDTAVGAGAKGIVSPGFTKKMARYCRESGIPYYPGVCTPSEVQMAREEGLQSLKFFPAELSGGLKMISLFKAIYQDTTFMPTGGISQDNLLQYLGHENILCCGGTWLSPENHMVEGRWQEIEQRVVSAVELLKS